MPKRYLVTGAAGFIGSRLGQTLLESGHTVVGVDALEHFQTRHEVSSRCTTAVARENVLNFLKEDSEPWDAIFHLGACTKTTEMDTSYLEKTNTEASKGLWNFAAARRIPFYYASSAATYGDGSQGYEDDESRLLELRPLNPYGESKHRFDLWALQEEARGNAPPAWAGFKFFNVYGFGESHKGSMASVVYHAFHQIRSGKAVGLFRSYRNDFQDGEQCRDFISVEDVLRVLTFSESSRLRRGIFNLGTGQARSFLDLIRPLFESLDAPERIEFIPMPESLQARYQYFTQASMGRLRDAGYTRPFMSVEEGVRQYARQLQQAHSESPWTV